MADLDILSIDEALEAVGLTAASQSTPRVQAMTTGISGLIDRLCGPVVAREVVETLNGGRCSLLLSNTPVYEITEIVETSGTTDTTLTDADWQLESTGHYAVLHRRVSSSDSSWAYGSRNIAVELLSGRFEDTDSVDEYWKAGCRSILVQRWQRESAQWARNPSGDEFLPDGPFDTLAAVRATFPLDLLPPGLA